MKTKHTPGPWHIGREADHSSDRFNRNAEWARIRGVDNGLIAKIESVHPNGKRQSKDFDIEAANARLIAAAPDLYFACRSALLTLEDDENYYRYKDVIETVRNAIAAAE